MLSPRQCISKLVYVRCHKKSEIVCIHIHTYIYIYMYIYIYICVCVCLPTMILVIALQVITSSSVNSLFLDILSSSPWNLFHRNAIDIIQQSYMKIAFLSHFPGAIASIKSALMVRLLSGVIATSASRCPSLAISLWGINRLMRGPVWEGRETKSSGVTQSPHWSRFFAVCWR